MAEADQEKRSYPRVPAELVAELRAVPMGNHRDDLPAAVKDVSAGGVFVETPMVLSPGSLVILKLSIPDEERPRTVMGLVRWRREAAPRGVGVQFVALTPAPMPEVLRSVKEGAPSIGPA